MKKFFNFFKLNTFNHSLIKNIQKKPFAMYVNHRDTEDNNDKTPFDFTPQNYKKIEEILSKYPKNRKRSGIMPLLWLAQEQNNNFLTLAAMQKVAKILEVPEILVFEVASFYTMYNRTYPGKYHLQVCGTTPCMVRGSKELIDAACKHLGTEKEHVTHDGMFKISEVECLGACVNAPMMQVNNKEFYEDLTPDSLINIIENFRNGKENKVGPQNGRLNSIGPLGRTSLNEFESKPITRDFVAAKRDWDEAREKLKQQAAAGQK